MTSRTTARARAAATDVDPYHSLLSDPAALGQVLVMAWAAHDAAQTAAMSAQLLDVLVDEGDACYDEPLLRIVAVAAFVLGRTWGRQSRGETLEARPCIDPLEAHLDRTRLASHPDGRALERRRRVLPVLIDAYESLTWWRRLVHHHLGSNIGPVLVDLILGSVCADCLAGDRQALAALAEVGFALGVAHMPGVEDLVLPGRHAYRCTRLGQGAAAVRRPIQIYRGG